MFVFVYCRGIVIIRLENGLERKKIIYVSYNGVEKLVSICNKNMYF